MTRTLLVVVCMAAACQRDNAPPPPPPPAPAAAVAAQPPRGKLELIEAPPAADDVAPYIAGELKRAATDHRQLLVYEGAVWCEPCGRFHHAATSGELDGEFPSLRVLVFDADRDDDALARAGYHSPYIPLFAIPDADGTASGLQIAGGTKGDDAVHELAPRLHALLANVSARASASASQ